MRTAWKNRQGALRAAVLLLALIAARGERAFPAATELPPPVPPQYDKLKDLYLDIPLVKAGRPAVAIVVPAQGIDGTAATVIQRAIESHSGVQVPIVSADSPEAAVPIRGNLIVLGNRSTNTTMNALYDLCYCLVDLF